MEFRTIPTEERLLELVSANWPHRGRILAISKEAAAHGNSLPWLASVFEVLAWSARELALRERGAPARTFQQDHHNF